jgi:hypothetical protein
MPRSFPCTSCLSRHDTHPKRPTRHNPGLGIVTSLGPAFTLNNAWQFFMGYRFAVFNYATQALGGAVTVRRFDLTVP